MRNNGDEAMKKIYRTHAADVRFSAGVTMFWMGGSQTLVHQVKLSSTDPFKIRAFVEFLERYCNVHRGEMKISLLLYPDLDPDSARRFWSFSSGISPSGFYKIGKLPPRKKVRTTSQGLCTLIVHNARLKHTLSVWVELQKRELIEQL